MKNIYYTVSKQLNDVDGFEETNGWKDISVYEINNSKLVKVFDLEIPNTKNTEKKILKEISKIRPALVNLKLIEL